MVKRWKQTELKLRTLKNRTGKLTMSQTTIIKSKVGEIITYDLQTIQMSNQYFQERLLRMRKNMKMQIKQQTYICQFSPAARALTPILSKMFMDEIIKICKPYLKKLKVGYIKFEKSKIYMQMTWL